MKKSKKETIDGLGVVEVFETEYPELAEEYKRIGTEMYEMFAAKHMDYGLNNIALGGRFNLMKQIKNSH